MVDILVTSDFDAFQISFKLSFDKAVFLSSFEACSAGINPLTSLSASAAMSQTSLPDIAVGKLRATDLGRGLGGAAGLAVAAALPVGGGAAKSLIVEATMLDHRRVGVGAPPRLVEDACRVGTGADADRVGVVIAAAAAAVPCRAPGRGQRTLRTLDLFFKMKKYMYVNVI